MGKYAEEEKRKRIKHREGRSLLGQHASERKLGTVKTRQESSDIKRIDRFCHGQSFGATWNPTGYVAGHSEGWLWDLKADDWVLKAL